LGGFMSNMDDAIQLIQQGRKAEAKVILQAVIRNDPRNITAWFWYVETCTTAEQRIQALEICLKMNPGNPQVSQALQMLREQVAPASFQPAPPKPAPPPTQRFSYPEEKPVPVQNNDLYNYDSHRSSFEPVRASSYYEEGQDDQYEAFQPAPETAQSTASEKKPWDIDQFKYVDNSMLSKSKKAVRTYGSFDVWATVLTVQDVATYEDILKDPKAGLGRAFAWIAVAGLVSALAAPFMVWLNPQFSELTSAQSSDMTSFLVFFTAIMLIVAPISSIISLAISGGIQHLLAMLFGGEGTYTRTIYALAAFSAPMSILISFLAIIPIAGQCLTIPLAVYGLILNVRALRAAHSLSTGAAIGVIFAPGILVLLFGCLLFFLMGGMSLAQ
ncbi:MAG: Yip1 family protein, partial [Chloroflexota bacterium]